MIHLQSSVFDSFAAWDSRAPKIDLKVLLFSQLVSILLKVKQKKRKNQLNINLRP